MEHYSKLKRSGVSKQEIHYKNPPITEATCEIKFTEDSNWDVTIPGLIYEKIKGRFTLKERSYLREINIIPSEPDKSPEIVTHEFATFRTESRNTLAKVGSEIPVLKISRLKPYISWNDYKPYIEDVIQAVQNLKEVKAEELKRVSLQYSNTMVLPGKPVKLEDYFEFRPLLGNDLPQEPLNFIVGSLFLFSENRDGCKMELATTFSEKSESTRETTTVRLDLEYFLVKSKAIAFDEVHEWIDLAHQKIWETFEGCIKDPLREIFGREGE